MNAANSAFMVLSTILVLFMTPGLAFFYGGLVSKRNVVSTMLSVFVICGIAILLFIAVGYELAFNGDIGGVIGKVDHFFLGGVSLTKLTATKIPESLYFLFEMMFAIITPALFVGAVVGRIRFNFLLVFIVFWSLLIYYPMVHMVWSANGWLARMGMLDFAGGTVVHINAGVTAYVLSAFLGRRLHPHQDQPYNLPWVLCGTAILWIGWYGFNAGSALAINQLAVTAMLTTTVATATSMVVWLILEMTIRKQVSLAGICTGTLCGLVGITPAAGYVTVGGAFWIGLLATLASYGFVHVLKARIGIDDALDAFGCHGVAGITGSILTGVFATRTVNRTIAENGLLYGGGWHLLGIQTLATGITIILVAIASAAIVLVLRRFVAMRVSATDERVGLDESEHGEHAENTDEYSTEIGQHHKEFAGQLAHFNRHQS
ncbi:ammonium transporter [Furfurilactobacillus milii]|uniref:Ammonium transporter n=1 Tax=Furfurilactobacillus milii TaxID=2888272 RepID=A0A6N9I389_9LACO|nr:ammonium transporter [Furfurilactobacillus milii]MYV17430.1 ammonium transporter [Furfurilactobacillus milii]